MKITIPHSNHNFFVLICLFTIGIGFGQEQKQSSKTLFGKQIKTESVNPQNGYVRCASTEYEKYLQEKNPKRMTETQFEAWVTPLVNRYAAMRSTSKTGTTVITIPVVVHVIYNGQAIGVAPNITDNQVISQITVLNQDYSKLIGTPGYNTNPVGANTQIQFILAQQDPNGNPTNGIDRVSLCQTSWSDLEMDSTVKPNTIWDPTQYMNMWSVNFSDNTLLGYAQFPDGSTLAGIPTTNGAANSDGVVSNYDVFGTNAANDGTFLLNATYNKGRTMTHEVGHFLGLRHIWGDVTSGCGDDYCPDTPKSKAANYGCPSPIPLSCDTPPVNEMIDNYMDYTDDACMDIFTQNQASRMAVVMTNSPRRSTLKTSTKATPVTLYANDAEIKLEANCDMGVCGAIPNQTIQKVIIYNRGTTTLTAATLNYTINGGVNNVYNWTGSLAINQSATFGITINSTANGTINISVATANGVTDQRSSNNSATGTFVIPTAVSNYPFTNFIFRLQQDYWGSETTWNLKNSSGTILQSGGPYTDTYINATTISAVPTLITENWSLPANQCYTFTINDKSGDGICCGTGLGSSGDGFYDIKSTNGLTTVTSGASFGSSQSYSFTTNSLGVNAFETSSDIYLYPNPAKGTINISIPSNFGLPNSYTIYNSIGQIINHKEVSFQPDLTVNTSALSNGIYFITIAKDDAKKTLQFIKN